MSIPPLFFPTPLLSITLRTSSSSSSSSSSQQKKQQGDDPLRQSCIKRQLVGSVIAFDPKKESSSITTQLRVPFLQDNNNNTVIELQVESIIEPPKRQQGYHSTSNNTSLFYWILPSTRITLLPGEVDSNMEQAACPRGDTVNNRDDDDDDDDKHQQTDRPNNRLKTNDTKNTKKAFSSPVARRMIETVHCIRGPRPMMIAIPTTFLLTGPPGVGKTFAVHLVYNQCRTEGPTKLFSIQGSELLASNQHHPSSEASVELKRLFYKAIKFCQQSTQHIAILFMDECDALFSSQPVTAMLATLLDQVSGQSTNSSSSNASKQHQRRPAYRSRWQRLLVVAATNRIDCVPANLRRSGRIDQEIPVSPPTAQERATILQSLLLLETNTYTIIKDDNNNHGSKHHNMETAAAATNDETATTTTTPLTRQNIQELANDCVGYVPADLTALVRTASLLAIQEFGGITDSSNKTTSRVPQITYELMKRAMMQVGASALRDASMSAPPRIGWDDIAGDPGGAKMELRRSIEWPRTKQEAYKRLGLVPPRGILLYGPPGCAKTTLARAAAGATGVAFVSLSPADVYASSYVGEAEAVVRRAFTLARSTSPCILFFDEIDSIIGGDDGGDDSSSSSNSMIHRRSGSSAESRVLSTFLNEMDGVDSGNSSSSSSVMVLGATNRPWTLDAALLRPGRFDKAIYVPPPDLEGRISIFRMQLARYDKCLLADKRQDDNNNRGNDVDCHGNETNKRIDSIVDHLAQDSISGSMTGAEIVGACREGGMRIFRDKTGAQATGTTNTIAKHKPISMDTIQYYLEESLRKVKPLLSNQHVLDDYLRFEESRYK